MANRAERRADTRKRKMKLEELQEQAIEAMGQIAHMEIEVGDSGEVVRIPHPMLVDDETQARIEAFQAGEDLKKDEEGNIDVPHRKPDGSLAEPDSARMARAVLGPVTHERYVKAGGNSNAITLAWQYMTENYRDRQAEDPK